MRCIRILMCFYMCQLAMKNRIWDQGFGISHTVRCQKCLQYSNIRIIDSVGDPSRANRTEKSQNWSTQYGGWKQISVQIKKGRNAPCSRLNCHSLTRSALHFQLLFILVRLAGGPEPSPETREPRGTHNGNMHTDCNPSSG